MVASNCMTRTATGFTMRSMNEQAERAVFQFDEQDNAWYLLRDEQRIKLVQLVETEEGNYVRVFKEDGTSTLVDANLRKRSAVLDALKQSEAETTL